MLAGYYAKHMGVPVQKLIIGSNENNVLHRVLHTGCYERTDVVPTTSPSMDIQVSSNFERYLYYLFGGNAVRLAEWMGEFKQNGRGVLDSDAVEAFQSEFSSSCVTQDQVRVG